MSKLLTVEVFGRTIHARDDLAVDIDSREVVSALALGRKAHPGKDQRSAEVDCLGRSGWQDEVIFTGFEFNITDRQRRTGSGPVLEHRHRLTVAAVIATWFEAE